MKNAQKIVVIPSYEPPISFSKYVKELIDGGVDSVIVVNDGSSEFYNGTYNKINKIRGVTLLKYEENLGKGYALKFAFNHIKNTFNGNYAVVTADCDGQHAVSDVLKLFNTAFEFPHSLILGSRDFSSENVPKRSRFGNLNTRRMFKLLYGLNLKDTQTGLRAFTNKLIDDMLKISGNRFEYEMNVLIVLYKQNVNIIEIPIETIYIDKQEGANKRSHFKTFSDSFKVWKVLLKNVNTYLLAVVLSLTVEICIFTIGEYTLFKRFTPSICTLFSVVTARITSSIVNYLLNYKMVFNGKGKTALLRYYCLWLALLSSSYLLTNFFGNVLGLPIVLFKLIVDGFLAIISYRVQVTWVFPHKSEQNP